MKISRIQELINLINYFFQKFCLPPAFTEEKINKESNIASCSARDF